MKSKYLVIYIVVGVAFLAASLWVFLSKGKSAKAIRYKYKLGGIMLTAWAMLTFASCEGPGPFVTCYDPAPPEYAYIEGTTTYKNGDVMLVHFVTDLAGKYKCRIAPYDKAQAGETLQEQEFECVAGTNNCKITLAVGDFKGDAILFFIRIVQGEDGSEREIGYVYTPFTII